MASPRPSQSAGRRSSGGSDVYIGQFKRLEAIGKGSFAIVYKAVHPSDKSLLAIKTVQHSQLKGKLKANLFSEIDILKSIKHPHIVALINILESANHIHLVMEFCQLGDLATFVKKRDKLALHPVTAEMVRNYPNPPGAGFNEVVVRHFAKQLASALEFLRSKNLVHRDLKPQNLLLNPPPSWIVNERPENRPYEVAKSSLIPAVGIESLPVLKIADFGFARQLENKGMAETLCGSPLYMAPEILRYEKYDAKADLWSVGTVLYELTTGKPPFRAANHVDLLRKIERAMDRIRFPDECDISEDMQKVIRALLKKMPTERMSWQNFFDSSIITNAIPGLIHSDKPRRDPSSTSLDAEAVPASIESSRSKPAREANTDANVPQDRQSIPRRFSSARVGASGTPPGPSPLSHRQDADGSATRPPLPSHATAPVAAPRLERAAQPTSMERRRSQNTPSPGTSVPRTSGERDRALDRQQDRAGRDAREKAALEVAFERDYVVVEKRQVQVNAIADELAASPQIHGAPNPPPSMVRRATAQGLQPSAVPSANARNMQIATRTEAQHERKNSYERRYGPNKASATSALAAALNMVQYRLYGGSLPFGKNPSPPQGYGPFPTFPAQPTGPLLIESGNSKSGPVDEDQRVLTTIEERATRSDVVYGFAEVKYKQLIPVAPSNDNILGIRRLGAAAADVPNDDDDDDLTPDAVVAISEEALVLYVKALAILTNTITIAGSWWTDKSRGETHGEAASSRQTGNGRSSPANASVRINHVVQWARNRFNECLEKSEYVSRRLIAAQQKLPPSHPGHPDNHASAQGPHHNDMANSQIHLSSGVTAEKLMYDRAIDMSRTAAVNELVGEDLLGCEVSFLTAKRLLEAVLEDDEEPSAKRAGEAKGLNDKKTDTRDEGINGMFEEDRARVNKLVESMNSRLAVVRKKIALHQAARRASASKAPNPPSPTVPNAPQSLPTARPMSAAMTGRMPTPLR